jgi:hypothetical protein
MCSPCGRGWRSGARGPAGHPRRDGRPGLRSAGRGRRRGGRHRRLLPAVAHRGRVPAPPDRGVHGIRRAGVREDRRLLRRRAACAGQLAGRHAHESGRAGRPGPAEVRPRGLLRGGPLPPLDLRQAGRCQVIRRTVPSPRAVLITSSAPASCARSLIDESPMWLGSTEHFDDETVLCLLRLTRTWPCTRGVDTSAHDAQVEASGSPDPAGRCESRSSGVVG